MYHGTTTKESRAMQTCHHKGTPVHSEQSALPRGESAMDYNFLQLFTFQGAQRCTACDESDEASLIGAIEPTASSSSTPKGRRSSSFSCTQNNPDADLLRHKEGYLKDGSTGGTRRPATNSKQQTKGARECTTKRNDKATKESRTMQTWQK